jgi:hypothetical protein
MNPDPASDSEESGNLSEPASDSSRYSEALADSTHDDLPPEFGTSPTHDELPVSATSPAHDGSPPVSATLPTHVDSSPESVTLPTHHVPEPGTPQFQDDSQRWTWTPNTEIVPASPMHDEVLSQPLHEPESGAPPLHDDSTSKTYVPWWTLDHGANSVVGSSAHGESAPESEAPQLHGNLPPVSEAPLSSAESVASAPTVQGEEKGKMEPSPNFEKFFTEEMMQKVKDYAVLGTVAGVSTGIINAWQKEIMGTVSPGAYVYLLFPLSTADI